MAKTGSEDIDIFEDLQYQNFGDSQEYFDYLKERSQEYAEYASDPEKVKKDREKNQQEFTLSPDNIAVEDTKNNVAN